MSHLTVGNIGVHDSSTLRTSISTPYITFSPTDASAHFNAYINYYFKPSFSLFWSNKKLQLLHLQNRLQSLSWLTLLDASASFSLNTVKLSSVLELELNFQLFRHSHVN